MKLKNSIKSFLLSKFTNLLFISIFTILLTSCAIQNSKSNLKSRDKPIVLTTFTILADLAENVSGDRLVIKSITKRGSEIHGYQFTPSDLIRAKGASLILENGLGLESWIKKFTSNLGDVPTVVLSDGIDPLLIEGDRYSGKPNPHVWMSPKRVVVYIDKIVEAFTELDPLGEELFIENANRYKSKLKILDAELENALSKIPSNQRFIVSCEGAFSYLANDYGLKEAYLWPVNAESQVTPRRMTKLIKTIQQNKIPTIFCESTVSSNAQREVARSSGAKYGGEFYVDSLSSASGPASTLLKLQRHNLQILTEGISPFRTK